MTTALIVAIFQAAGVVGLRPLDFSLDRQWTDNIPNNYREEFTFEAGDKRVLTGIRGEHDNGSEDRRWQFGHSQHADFRCTPLSWTGFKNRGDERVDFTCPKGSALYGVSSRYSEPHRDREWRFRCCEFETKDSRGNEQYYMESTYGSGFVNEFDGRIDLTCNRNSVLVGVKSVHSDEREDRRWEFVCGLMLPKEGRTDTNPSPHPKTSLRIERGRSELEAGFDVADPTWCCGTQNGALRVKNDDECEAQCLLHEECTTWVTNYPEKRGSGDRLHCWLSSSGYRVPNGSRHSGWPREFVDVHVGRNGDDAPVNFKFSEVDVPECFVYNLDYFGGDVGDYPATSAKECQGFCQRHSECRFFSWSSTRKHCFLKNSNGLSRQRQRPNSVSGAKFCSTAGKVLNCPEFETRGDYKFKVEIREDSLIKVERIDVGPHVKGWNVDLKIRCSYKTNYEPAALRNENQDCYFQCHEQSGRCSFCGSGKCCRKGVKQQGCNGEEGGEANHQCIAQKPVLEHAGENCWEACDYTSGPCDWCGSGKCCRKGYNGGENGCKADEGFDNFHGCVATPVVQEIDPSLYDTRLPGRKITYTNDFDHSFDFEHRGSPVEVSIGSSTSNTKTVTDVGAGGLSCPKEVSRDNWLSEVNSSERFSVEVINGKDVKITRTFSVHSTDGWGLYLEIPCYESNTFSMIAGVTSHHNNKAEDRRFRFLTTSVAGLKCLPTQGWTDYQNFFDEEVQFTCPDHHALMGFSSAHSNEKEDRRYRFRCCDVTDSGFRIAEKRYTSPNEFDAEQNQVCSHNEVAVGMTSYHDNDKEDRRFRLQCGVLEKGPADADDCVSVHISDVIVHEDQVVYGTPERRTAQLNTVTGNFNFCNNPTVPDTNEFTLSGTEEIEKTDTIELSRSLDQHFSWSVSTSFEFTYGQSFGEGVGSIFSGGTSSEYSFTVGFERSLSGGWNIGSSSTRSSTTGTTSSRTISLGSNFAPLQYTWLEARAQYFQREVRVPVTLTAVCRRADGQTRIADVDSQYITSGHTALEVTVVDRTSECGYPKCKCINGLGSKFVGSGCQNHPNFDGHEGCYVFDDKSGTCTNGEALGTDTPTAGRARDASSYDEGVDGSNFGWSYKSCKGGGDEYGLQFYPGDRRYTGPAYDDLVERVENKGCTFSQLGRKEYSTRFAAIQACYSINVEKPNTCRGVYDVNCDNRNEWLLCAEGSRPLSNSRRSCVYEAIEKSPPFNPFSRSSRRLGGLDPYATRRLDQAALAHERTSATSISKLARRLGNEGQSVDSEDIPKPFDLISALTTPERFARAVNMYGDDLRDGWCEQTSCEDYAATAQKMGL